MQSISRTFRNLVSGFVLSAGLVVSAVTHAAAPSWDGNYSYERVYKNAAGEPAGEIYKVTLTGGKGCRITMTGPKSHEDIVCRIAKTEKSATLHFRRFADEKAAKLNDARAYKKDQQLLTFERGVSEKRAGEIRTIWHSLRTMDGKKPKGGVKFVRAKAA